MSIEAFRGPLPHEPGKKARVEQGGKHSLYKSFLAGVISNTDEMQVISALASQHLGEIQKQEGFTSELNKAFATILAKNKQALSEKSTSEIATELFNAYRGVFFRTLSQTREFSQAKEKLAEKFKSVKLDKLDEMIGQVVMTNMKIHHRLLVEDVLAHSLSVPVSSVSLTSFPDQYDYQIETGNSLASFFERHFSKKGASRE